MGNWNRTPNDYHQPRMTSTGETIPTWQVLAFIAVLIACIIASILIGY